MPALSQNLTFTISSGTSTVSTVQLVHPPYNNTLTYLSAKAKGDGYFGGSSGFHTVFWKITNFIGTIGVQGTLVADPTINDWVDITLTSADGIGTVYSMDTTGVLTTVAIASNTYTTPVTLAKSFNFIGNFVWVRAKVSDWTQGTVNVISINR